LAYFLTAVQDKNQRRQLRLKSGSPIDASLSEGQVLSCSSSEISLLETLRLVSWIQEHHVVGIDWVDPVGVPFNPGLSANIARFNRSVKDTLQLLAAGRGRLRFETHQVINGQPLDAQQDEKPLQMLLAQLRQRR
ncbi:MAG: hypothetical protein AAFN74_18025, partial [Myxococcota bacterium]